jgi:hypothetical protein
LPERACCVRCAEHLSIAHFLLSRIYQHPPNCYNCLSVLSNPTIQQVSRQVHMPSKLAFPTCKWEKPILVSADARRQRGALEKSGLDDGRKYSPQCRTTTRAIPCSLCAGKMPLMVLQPCPAVTIYE